MFKRFLKAAAAVLFLGISSQAISQHFQDFESGSIPGSPSTNPNGLFFNPMDLTTCEYLPGVNTSNGTVRVDQGWKYEGDYSVWTSIKRACWESYADPDSGLNPPGLLKPRGQASFSHQSQWIYTGDEKVINFAYKVPDNQLCDPDPAQATIFQLHKKDSGTTGDKGANVLNIRVVGDELDQDHCEFQFRIQHSSGGDYDSTELRTVTFDKTSGHQFAIFFTPCKTGAVTAACRLEIFLNDPTFSSAVYSSTGAANTISDSHKTSFSTYKYGEFCTSSLQNNPTACYNGGAGHNFVWDDSDSKVWGGWFDNMGIHSLTGSGNSADVAQALGRWAEGELIADGGGSGSGGGSSALVGVHPAIVDGPEYPYYFTFANLANGQGVLDNSGIFSLTEVAYIEDTAGNKVPFTYMWSNEDGGKASLPAIDGSGSDPELFGTEATLVLYHQPLDWDGKAADFDNTTHWNYNSATATSYSGTMYGGASYIEAWEIEASASVSSAYITSKKGQASEVAASGGENLLCAVHVKNIDAPGIRLGIRANSDNDGIGNWTTTLGDKTCDTAGDIDIGTNQFCEIKTIDAANSIYVIHYGGTLPAGADSYHFRFGLSGSPTSGQSAVFSEPRCTLDPSISNATQYTFPIEIVGSADTTPPELNCSLVKTDTNSYDIGCSSSRAGGTMYFTLVTAEGSSAAQVIAGNDSTDSPAGYSNDGIAIVGDTLTETGVFYDSEDIACLQAVFVDDNAVQSVVTGDEENGCIAAEVLTAKVINISAKYTDGSTAASDAQVTFSAGCQGFPDEDLDTTEMLWATSGPVTLDTNGDVAIVEADLSIGSINDQTTSVENYVRCYDTATADPRNDDEYVNVHTIEEL